MTEVSLDDGIVALRPWRTDDAEAIVACIDGDPEISRWLDVVPQPYTLEDARTPFQKMPYAILVAVLLFFGFWPKPLLEIIDQGTKPIVATVEHARSASAAETGSVGK